MHTPPPPAAAARVRLLLFGVRLLNVEGRGESSRSELDLLGGLSVSVCQTAAPSGRSRIGRRRFAGACGESDSSEVHVPVKTIPTMLQLYWYLFKTSKKVTFSQMCSFSPPTRFCPPFQKLSWNLNPVF